MVFTDGAYEPNMMSCGVVLFSSDMACPSRFGLKIPLAVVASWREYTGEQVAAQAELAPVLLARLTWGHILVGRMVVCFLEKEGAREGVNEETW